MKKVIISTHDSISPIKGGGALRTLKAAQEFKRRGQKVILIAPTDGRGEIDGLKIDWLHPPRKQRSQILSSLKFNIRLLRKFLQFIRETEMFFIHNTISAATIPFLKKFFRFKFVLDITDIHAEYLPLGRRNIIERILTPYLLRYEYWIIRSADFIIVVTQAMKKLLVEKGVPANKIEVVYDGVDKSKFSIQKFPQARYGIIHLGAIDRQHGVELLVESIPLVLEKKPQAKFFFVGGGRELLRVKKIAQRLQVEQHCTFTDYLPHAQAVDYLQKAVIGVIPRRDYLPNRIITTLKIYEYWASGTAVVASRLRGIEEIAENYRNVLFFESGNAKDLACKILQLLDDEELRNRLIYQGLREVDNYRWDRLIPEVVDLALDSHF